MKRVRQLLDYMATHPEAKIRFWVSDMILNVHSDASYLSSAKDRSRAWGYSFLGSLPTDGKAIQLNGNIMITYKIHKLVASSAAEAELSALFVNTKEARILRLTLQELSHPQPQTPIHVDNTTIIGISWITRLSDKDRAQWKCDNLGCLTKWPNNTSNFTTNPA